MKTLLKERKSIGWSRAIHHFYQRRHLPVVAYLVLAGFTGYAFQAERNHSNQNRVELAQQTHTVLVRGCERQNDLRKALVSILNESYKNINQYVKDGTITPEQAKRARAQTRAALLKIRPTDCLKAYPVAKS
jgi:hypothetical protein